MGSGAKINIRLLHFIIELFAVIAVAAADSCQAVAAQEISHCIKLGSHAEKMQKVILSEAGHAWAEDPLMMALIAECSGDDNVGPQFIWSSILKIARCESIADSNAEEAPEPGDFARIMVYGKSVNQIE